MTNRARATQSAIPEILTTLFPKQGNAVIVDTGNAKKFFKELEDEAAVKHQELMAKFNG